jgi:hypothetical protein
MFQEVAMGWKSSSIAIRSLAVVALLAAVLVLVVHAAGATAVAPRDQISKSRAVSAPIILAQGRCYNGRCY